MKCFVHIHLLFLVQVSLIYIFAYSDCDKPIQREGIKTQCITSGGQSRFRTTNCALQETWPTGTTAFYSCENRFYFSSDDVKEGNITCNENGRWIGWSQFFAFSCNISKCKYCQPEKQLLGFKQCTLSSQDCGVSLALREQIIGGKETPSVFWPWHATIFARQEISDQFRYICGGTLIKPKSKSFAVISAAHCLAEAGRIRGELAFKPRSLDNVRIVLGGESSSWTEVLKSEIAQILRPRTIIIHESFGGQASSFQGDIGIVLLEDPIKLSLHSLPACLNSQVDKTEVGNIGKVVGFGLFDDTRLVSTVLREGNIPVANKEFCNEWRERKLLPQEICAGFDNNTFATCDGDSGGGYMFQDISHGATRYFLQGIVSHGRKTVSSNKNTCDTHSVFTKVVWYSKWINDVLDNFPQNSTTMATPEKPVTPFPLCYPGSVDTRCPQIRPNTQEMKPTPPPVCYPGTIDPRCKILSKESAAEKEIKSISYDQFSKAVTSNRYSQPSREKYNSFVNNAFSKGGIETKAEAAMALAQFIYISAGLQSLICELCEGMFSTPTCGAPGQTYIGRGYVGFTGCEVYKNTSLALYGDERLVEDPDLINKNDTIAWDTSFWYWKRFIRTAPGVLEGKFGATTKVIYSDLCHPDYKSIARVRYDIYERVREALGIAGDADERGCYN